MPDASQGEIRNEDLRCGPSVGPRSGWERGLAAGFAGEDLRAKSRHFVLCAPKRRLRAAVLASSRGLCGAADPKRRAFTPAGEDCGGVTLRFCVSAAPRGSVMLQGRAGFR